MPSYVAAMWFQDPAVTTPVGDRSSVAELTKDDVDTRVLEGRVFVDYQVTR